MTLNSNIKGEGHNSQGTLYVGGMLPPEQRSGRAGEGSQLSYRLPVDDGGGLNQLSLTNYSSPFVSINWFIQCVFQVCQVNCIKKDKQHSFPYTLSKILTA